MSDKENDVENLAIDPPDNQGGGNVTAANLESSGTGEETAPIDPPDNQGGGSGG
jgi:hypothetical protein